MKITFVYEDPYRGLCTYLVEQELDEVPWEEIGELMAQTFRYGFFIEVDQGRQYIPPHAIKRIDVET